MINAKTLLGAHTTEEKGLLKTSARGQITSVISMYVTLSPFFDTIVFFHDTLKELWVTTSGLSELDTCTTFPLKPEVMLEVSCSK